jgi:uncharacterized membrane protein
MDPTKLSGMAIAAAAATLFIAGAGTSAAAEGGASYVKTKCFGVNACKGQSVCKCTGTACKGQNACKGEGFEFKPIGACERAGRA